MIFYSSFAKKEEENFLDFFLVELGLEPKGGAFTGFGELAVF